MHWKKFCDGLMMTLTPACKRLYLLHHFWFWSSDTLDTRDLSPCAIDSVQELIWWLVLQQRRNCYSQKQFLASGFFISVFCWNSASETWHRVQKQCNAMPPLKLRLEILRSSFGMLHIPWIAWSSSWGTE